MLVLTRRARAGQNRILVGPGIVVEIVSVDRDKVRVGVVAPDDLLILREELKEEGNANMERRS